MNAHVYDILAANVHILGLQSVLTALVIWLSMTCSTSSYVGGQALRALDRKGSILWNGVQPTSLTI